MLKKQDTAKRSEVRHVRRFLVTRLPDGCLPSNPHDQIFDNYVPDSHLRFRKVRDPGNDERWYSIEKEKAEKVHTRIELSREDYEALSHWRGRETRKNRYYLSAEGHDSTMDIFLGDLWGLNLWTVAFENAADCADFEPHEDVILEITSDPFFFESNLVEMKISDVKDHLSQKKKGAESAS